MNGPQHYAEAERLAKAASAMDAYEDRDPPEGHLRAAEVYAARAQIHATLALAAAVGELDHFPQPGSGLGRYRVERDAWRTAFNSEGGAS